MKRQKKQKTIYVTENLKIAKKKKKEKTSLKKIIIIEEVSIICIC